MLHEYLSYLSGNPRSLFFVDLSDHAANKGLDAPVQGSALPSNTALSSLNRNAMKA